MASNHTHALNRRQFLGAAAAGAMALAAEERPNILVLLSDQHSPHVFGAYGDPIVRTPNLDALAAGGVQFDHAYCPSPICVPSRMSFLTGRTPSENQVWSNADTLPSDTPTFAHTFGAAGYDTALIGRMHFSGPDQWHGFGRRLVGSLTPIYPNYSIPLTPELLLGAQNATHKGLQASGYGKTAYIAYDEEVTSTTVDFLREKGRQRTKPFCVVSGFVLPHAPYVCPKEDWDYYLDRVRMPEIPSNYLERLHPAIRHWRTVRGLNQASPEEIRRARAGYYGLVTHYDRLVGRIMSALKESGLERNTIVVYTTDHGDMAGELGLFWKSTFFEGSVSVPLIFSWPGTLTHRRVKRLANTIDVGPTLAALAKTDPMPLASGRNLAPVLRGEAAGGPDEVFSEFPPSMGSPAIRMIRSGNWKLIHYDGMQPQLFDLAADPQEFHDLAADPGHQEVRRRLQARVLDGWSADVIQREQARRAKAGPVLRKWAQEVQPEAPLQWKAPPNANEYTLPK